LQASELLALVVKAVAVVVADIEFVERCGSAVRFRRRGSAVRFRHGLSHPDAEVKTKLTF
jgi:hypothetical protein